MRFVRVNEPPTMGLCSFKPPPIKPLFPLKDVLYIDCYNWQNKVPFYFIVFIIVCLIFASQAFNDKISSYTHITIHHFHRYYHHHHTSPIPPPYIIITTSLSPHQPSPLNATGQSASNVQSDILSEW